jgi:hypothetical protein
MSVQTYEAEANFLFPDHQECEDGDCDWCLVYYDGLCPDCGHHVNRHRGRYGCGGEGDDVPCGCERLADFYRQAEAK